MDKVLTVINLRDILTCPLRRNFKFQLHLQKEFLLDRKYRYCVSMYMQSYAF